MASTLEKRVRILEKEVRELRSSLVARTTKKKIPDELATALKEVQEGKTYGPFRSIKTLRKSLEA